MMDLSSYKELYIKTAKDNVAQFRASLQTLASQPTNKEVLEDAFRGAHSLKGKTLMMGDTELAALAKTMEDILSEVKNGTRSITPDMFTALTAGADKIDVMISGIVQTPPVQSPSVAQTTGISIHSLRILVMEDDPFFQKFYSTKLTEQGFAVTVAQDGEEGLRKLPQVNPNIILLDIIMPKKDGFEVLQALGNQQNKIPIIVFSSLGQDQDIQRAKNLGANDYVNKSFYDFDQLLAKIKTLTHI